MADKIKLLYYGDAPTCATGFAQVSKNILMGLHNTGRYEIQILGVNYWGDPHDYPFDIWPIGVNSKTGDPYGRQRAAELMRDLEYDVLFQIQDSFILSFMESAIPQLKAHGKKFGHVMYFPIDGHPKKSWIKAMNVADIPVTYTQYGRNKCIEVMPEIASKLLVVPHGTNPKDFYPAAEEDVKEFRKSYFKQNADKFIFTNVNRNQQRKDIPRTMLAFKEFKKRRPNSCLYLHCATKDMGHDLGVVAEEMGFILNTDVCFPGNFNPTNGYPIEVINMIYNASDAIISTTLGEGWGLCLHGSTRVMTTGGMLPIKDINVGQKVVVAGKSYNISGKVATAQSRNFKIELENHIIVDSSPEHKFVTYNRGHVPASELVSGDQLVIDKAVFYPDKKYTIDLSEFSGCHDDKFVWNKMGFSPLAQHSISTVMHHTGETKKIVETAIRFYDGRRGGEPSERVREVVFYLEEIDYSVPLVKLPRFIDFNADFARLLGYYTAEGSNEKGKAIEFCFHREEEEYISDVVSLCNRFFSHNPQIKTRDNKTEIRLRSSIVSKLFSFLCGIHAHNKKVPLLCLQQKNKATEFLKGYWRGDGTGDKWTFSFSTASPQLMSEVTWMLTGFGILPRLYKKSNPNDAWNIVVTGRDFNKFSSIMGLVVKHDTYKEKNWVEEKEKYFVVPIKSVEIEYIDDNYYDIQVDGKHHFIANGLLVHNSSTEAMSCKTPVIFPDNTSLREIIGDDRGFLVKSGASLSENFMQVKDNDVLRPMTNVGDMIDKMIFVHDNPEEVKKRVEAAYEWVSQNLVWEKYVVPQWDRIIQEAVKYKDIKQAQADNGVISGDDL